MFLALRNNLFRIANFNVNKRDSFCVSWS